jgi:hypothetical protein
MEGKRAEGMAQVIEHLPGPEFKPHYCQNFFSKNSDFKSLLYSHTEREKTSI